MFNILILVLFSKWAEIFSDFCLYTRVLYPRVHKPYRVLVPLILEGTRDRFANPFNSGTGISGGANTMALAANIPRGLAITAFIPSIITARALRS